MWHAERAAPWPKSGFTSLDDASVDHCDGDGEGEDEEVVFECEGWQKSPSKSGKADWA
jgi:hypothetical protein